MIEVGEHKLKADSLYQTNIYRGLIMGLPHQKRNDEWIKAAEEKAKEMYPNVKSGFVPFHLIEPPRTELKPGGNYPESIIERKGRPEKIPSIMCIADFESWKTVKDEKEMYSACVVAWFQDEIGDIDEDVIKTIDWPNVAKDFSD